MSNGRSLLSKSTSRARRAASAPQAIIEQAIGTFHAEALNGQKAELSEHDLAALARALRDDFIGLGALAERMLERPRCAGVDGQRPQARLPRRRRNASSACPVSCSPTTVRSVRFLDRLLEQVEGKRLDRITPRVEARLPDGSRLTAAIPPVSSNGHTICSIRRFRLAGQHARTSSSGSASSASRPPTFLAACVRAGKNIVVAGRVSAGKTTLLNALGRAIPGTERVVVCESSAELQLPAVLPELRRLRGPARERRRARRRSRSRTSSRTRCA